MTKDDKQDPSPTPGSAAGDTARTQAIPLSPNGAGLPASKTGQSTDSSQTDKGRPRESASSRPERQDGPSQPTDQTDSGDDESTNRTLTAADYARTTKQSASTTAVIPAVRERIDKLKDKKRSTPPVAPAVTGSGRRASLRLTHVEPWSVTRLAFAISVAMMIVAVVAVTIFWVVLEATGVWDQINGSVTSVLSDDSSSFNITDYLGFGRLVGLTLVLSAINVILLTAIATIGAHLYNLAAQLLGGVEVTFTEQK
ncbi:DUF3566 domain-containing protein [Aeromicrobium sp.]|uniref:DUF3566 domain-containing protein n=1 Tax=Aeromicrobium sp. TaxID=1871063 RepID=UPI003C34EA59